MSNFSILAKQRDLIAQVVADVTEDEWTAMALDRSNNIAWNLGHIVTIQQMLCYALSGNPLNVPTEYIAMYSRDTSPETWDTAPDIATLLEQLASLPEQTRADYDAGLFANYQPITTSTGVVLGTIDEAIAFNNFHEGLHTGVIMSIKRELRQ